MFYILNHIERKDILDTFIEATESEDTEIKNILVSKLLCFGLDNGLSGNLWQAYLIYMMIFNDNAFTRNIERVPNFYYDLELVEQDLKNVYHLYTQKYSRLQAVVQFENHKTTEISSVISNLMKNIWDYSSFRRELFQFYKHNGLGDMAIYKAFRVEKGQLFPIHHVLDVHFDDLVGYQEQKRLLIENTENFIYGKSYNNVLLYGDSGTGKSTSVKALLNMYFEKGLRVIEVYKHQMEEISKIIHLLKNRPYYFMIYMDDLSFDENEIEYKYLKSIIEGGIEPKPENVVIYSTSNRRHLIKETFTDNQTDDLHRNETQAEKLSLAYRFGLQIFYSSLSPKEFKSMVLELAKRNKIEMEETLLLQEASQWELTYGSLSGRCATQFINHLKNKQEN